MNTLLLIFLTPFLTSTAVGQVESVQIQSSFLETTALKFYCRYGALLNEDISRCTPKEVVQEQTVQEKVVEVVRNVFVPVAQAEQPSDSYLESMIRRIVLELLPQPQVITVKGEKGDKGDKGDPGTSGSNLLAFDGIQMPFWSGYGSGPSTSGGSTVINNNVNVTSNTLTYSTTTGLLTSDVGGVVGTTTILSASSSAPSWLLAGNAGTNPLNDFVGTTDAQDLVFRTNNVEQLRITQTGRFLAPNVTDNIFIDGGNETMTGTSNIGIGDGAVGSNTTGISNIALGQNALLFNTTGFSNMAIGQATLLMNNGNTNTAIGQGAGIVSTGNSNTYIGYGAGNTQSAGDNNIVIGQLANTGNGIGSNQLSIGNWIYGDNGNIGIGQSLPTERLDVVGNIQFSGALMPNNLSGALGTVLISQGAGLAPVWVSTSTLSGTTTNVVSFATTTGIFTSTVNGVVSTTTIPSSSGAWLLTGNTGTNANINFLGTTDNVDLVFKTNNATSGRITNDGQSTAFGLNAGNNASRFNTFFVGSGAGDSATNADYSTFIGIDSGNGATNASYSNFFGENAGGSAVNADNSNFLGSNTGSGATDASNSNFFGSSAGLNATNASASNFLGSNAGDGATFASESNFLGNQAGANATNATHSFFIGNSAGFSAINAANSIFIGRNSGNADTVNNTVSGTSILIGENTSTGGFSNSIALGASARNTATNQFTLGATTVASSINELYLGNNNTNAFPLIYSNLTGTGIGTTTVTERLTVGGNVRFSGALMPNNLAGATGTLLMSQGNGLAPVWTATSSLGFVNHWQKNTNVLSPNDAAVYQIAITNNAANTLTGFKTTNTNDVSNYAGAVLELKGSGADFTNNVYFGKYGTSFYIPSWAGNGVLATDKSLVLGALGNSSSIDFQVSGGYAAPITKMTLSSTTLRLISANFRLDGAFMPNNLAGATGTLLVSQGNGLAPVWTATSSLNLSVSSSTIASNFGFIQNGNSFGTTATLGTNDSFGLTLETVDTPRITIGTTGGVNVAGETGGGGAYTMNVAASASSHALRVTGTSDTIFAQQGAGSDVFFIRTAGTNTYLTASAGNTLILGVGGTTQNDFNITPLGDTSVRHRLFVSDAFTGSGTARIGQTIASATNSGNQTGATTQLLIQPNDGGLDSTGSNIGLDVNMGSLSGGTNYAAVFQNGNVGIGTTAPSERLEVSGNLRFSGALMPNNLSGATGTILLSQGNGLAPIWTATSSLNLSVSSSSIASNFGFIQNGNSFGTTATLGTNDAFNLQFETNNSVRMALTQAGRLTFTNVPGNVFLGGGNDATTGVGNVGVGILALASNTTGQNNVANGYAALAANTTGYNNTANGGAALTSNTTGYNNTANGILAMQFNISGINNVANGASALRFNTGNNNVASGVQAGYNNTSGSDNVIMGMNSFMGNVTGSRNVAIGSSAMINNTSNNNTALGYEAGYSIASGSGNTFIGYNTNTASGTITNSTALGANVMLAQSNTLILGNNVNVGIGTTTPTTKLHVVKGGSAGVAPHALSFAAFEANTDQYLSLLTPDANERGILFGETSNNTAGGIVYNNPSTPDGFQFRVNGNTTRLVISSSGMVGIGLGFNPGSVLSVNGNAAIGSSGYSDSAAPVNGLIVQGNTGIGTNTPLYLLHVGSASVVSGTTVARFENAGGTCDVTPNVAGGITCTSDQNLKKDIESIDPIDSLQKLLTVEVKSYRMNADASTSTKQTGFLAQQLETQFPGLVLTSVDGRKSVSYAGMTPILTQAIQTLYKFMTDIGVTIENGVAKVGEFVASKVKTDELCVGSVCVTESQFLQMVQDIPGYSNTTQTLSGNTEDDTNTPADNTDPTTNSDTSEDETSEQGESGQFDQSETLVSDTGSDTNTQVETSENVVNNDEPAEVLPVVETSVIGSILSEEI